MSSAAIWTGALFVILTLAGKLAALGKDVAFSYAFGAGRAADAYFIANQVPGIIWLAILATIGAVFTPLYVRKIGHPRARQRLATEAVRYYAMIAAALSIVAVVFAYPIVVAVAPSADPATRALAVDLTRIMTLGFVLTGYVGLQSAIQQAHRSFVPPLAVPVVNNLVAMGAILVAGWLGDVTFAVIGAVGAYLIQAVIQRMQTRQYYAFERGWKVRRRTWRRLSLLSAPLICAVLLDQLNLVIGTAIASDFGAGAISHWNYATRLTLLVSGTFSWLVAYMFFPALATNAARRNDAANAVVLARAIGLILIATAPAAAGALALRNDVVALVYQRGAFDQTDVAMTAGLFGILGFGIIFASLRELLNRVFFSYQQTVAPLLIGMAAMLINLVSSIWLSRAYGVNGIAAGAALGALAFCVGQIGVMFFWRRAILSRTIAVYFVSAVLAGSAAYFAAEFVQPALVDLSTFLRLCLAGILVIVVYVPLLLTFLALGGINPSALSVQMRGIAIRHPGPPMADPR